ncbi:MAG: Dabb family protein [Clostridia bacterium]|nr:Dabb family protein [Clostridia bacterium]MBQ3077113.1 Dabb family protein [Clostridia bacterium]
MIRHIVMFRFAEEADGRSKQENLEFARNKLLALPEVIPEIKSFEVHLNCNLNGTNCDICAIGDYENLDDLEAYRVHPAHKAVGIFMRAVAEQRAAFDFEV